MFNLSRFKDETTLLLLFNKYNNTVPFKTLRFHSSFLLILLKFSQKTQNFYINFLIYQVKHLKKK